MVKLNFRRPTNLRDGKSKIYQVMLSQTVMAFLVSFFVLLMLNGFISQSEIKDIAWGLEPGSWEAWTLVIWTSIFIVIVTSILTSTALSLSGKIDRDSLVRNFKSVLFASVVTIAFVIAISFWWMVIEQPEIMTALNGWDKFANWSNYVVYFNLIGTGGNVFGFWMVILCFYQGIYILAKYFTGSEAIW